MYHIKYHHPAVGFTIQQAPLSSYNQERAP